MQDHIELAVVAAVSDNGYISAPGGGLPWDLPGDLERFRALTYGSPVIMGRTTWESLPTDLPGRTPIVMSRSGRVGDELTAGSVKEALHLASNETKGVAFVAGGSEVYSQMMPLADRLFLTRVHVACEGGKRFPEWGDGEWVIDRTERRDGYTFHEYVRK